MRWFCLIVLILVLPLRGYANAGMTTGASTALLATVAINAPAGTDETAPSSGAQEAEPDCCAQCASCDICHLLAGPTSQPRIWVTSLEAAAPAPVVVHSYSLAPRGLQKPPDLPL